MGIGTTFSIILPAKKAAYPLKSLVNSKPSQCEICMIGSILIIDDEKGQRDILTAILQKQGYDITTVPGAREALTAP